MKRIDAITIAMKKIRLEGGRELLWMDDDEEWHIGRSEREGWGHHGFWLSERLCGLATEQIDVLIGIADSPEAMRLKEGYESD